MNGQKSRGVFVCQFPPSPHPNTIVLKGIRQEAEISSCSHPKNRIGYFSNHTIRRQLVVSTTNLGRSYETPNTQKQRCALFNIKEDTMNPLDSIPGTIASGFQGSRLERIRHNSRTHIVDGRSRGTYSSSSHPRFVPDRSQLRW